MNKKDIFWQTYLNIEKDFLEISRFIFIMDTIDCKTQSPSCHQLDTFSPYIADLLINCCVQIESLAKEIYLVIYGTKSIKNLYFDGDCLGAINKKWNTDKKIVIVNNSYFNLTKEENKILRPLKNAYKPQGIYWEKAYQAVKHDRWNNLYKGNVKALLQALAALYLLNVYYRNDSWIVKYTDVSKLDYSMGSRIFCVNPPHMDGQPWLMKEPVEGDSPFVVSYTKEGAERIQQQLEKDREIFREYFSKQPEFVEEEFKLKLAEAVKQESQESTVDYFAELSCYRLNKKIPRSLTYEERKRLLLASEEYNGWAYSRNKKVDDDITAENIQDRIDYIGRCYALDLKKNLGLLRWLPMALNEEISRVYIP